MMIRSMSARLTALITANCLAALAVAGLTLAGLWISAVISSGEGGASAAIGWGLVLGLFAALYSFAIAFPVYSIGLLVVGIPTWWVLHRTGLRGGRVFVLVAAIESAVAGALVFRLFAPGSEVAAPLLAIPGGLAGWAIWKYGYAAIKPPPARPS